jgi:8-oxo-dGTP diphosphatase
MLHVTCAIIEHEGKILICQRSPRMKLPLKWEFPGGKIEDGESMETCLIREVHEELGLAIRIREALTPVEHRYPDFSLTLYPFHCTLSGGELKLAEHAQAIWVTLEELPTYDWAEADLPIVRELSARIGTISYKPILLMKSETLWIITFATFILYEILNYLLFTSFEGRWPLYIVDSIAGFATTMFLAILVALPLAWIPYRQFTYQKKLFIFIPLCAILILLYLTIMLITT